MKRSAFLGLALTVVSAGSAKAQGLTMQMSNGWSFSFAGNVNAFLVYTNGDVSTAGAIDFGLVGLDRASRIRTGLLPAFATFEAKGKEAGLDLGVHFGFAPQIQSASIHDQFGAQIVQRAPSGVKHRKRPEFGGGHLSSLARVGGRPNTLAASATCSARTQAAAEYSS